MLIVIKYDAANIYIKNFIVVVIKEINNVKNFIFGYTINYILSLVRNFRNINKNSYFLIWTAQNLKLGLNVSLSLYS